MPTNEKTVTQPAANTTPKTNCGECLWNTQDVVVLQNGVCPKCGADYRSTLKGAK